MPAIPVDQQVNFLSFLFRQHQDNLGYLLFISRFTVDLNNDITHFQSGLKCR